MTNRNPNGVPDLTIWDIAGDILMIIGITTAVFLALAAASFVVGLLKPTAPRRGDADD